jgi:hypothetical protein
MKKKYFLIVLVAIVGSINNSSWAQETIITAPGEYVVPYGELPNIPVTKIVLEKVEPSQVKIGFGWTTNFWSTPVGHPEDNSSTGFVSASLPGPYGNTGDGRGTTYINYISWPEVWINGMKMGNITHNGTQFSYAEGITSEMFHVGQSGEYIELKPATSDVVEVKLDDYFTYNGINKGINRLWSGIVLSGWPTNFIGQIQSSYTLPVQSGTYTICSGDDYASNPGYFSPFIVSYPTSGISIVEKIGHFTISNPVQSVLFLTSEYPIQRVAVYSLTGTKLIEKNGDIREVEVSYLSPGIYVVQIVLKSGEVVSQKIVKEQDTM